MALTADVRDALDASLTLGVARYLAEHPDAEVGDSWMTPEVERWRARPVDEIAGEARRRLDELKRLQSEAGAEWEPVRVDALNAQMNLMSVENGTFRGAAGGLFDFLREAGADVQSFDIG